MDDSQRKVGARCRVCDEQLTVAEFRACSGAGHYCRRHLSPAAVQAAQKKAAPKRSRKRTPATGGNRRGRRVTESGAIEYSCKAQFARNGQIKRGHLATDHPAASEGGAVFLSNDIPYGPGEIAVLFIKDLDGRRIAEQAGFQCHD